MVWGLNPWLPQGRGARFVDARPVLLAKRLKYNNVCTFREKVRFSSQRGKTMRRRSPSYGSTSQAFEGFLGIDVPTTSGPDKAEFDGFRIEAAHE